MGCASVRVALQSRRLLMREAFAAYLRTRPDFNVVGHTADMADLAALCELRRPDVMLVDLRGVGREVLIPLRGLHERFPDVGLVGVYDQLLAPTLQEACRAGMAAAIPASRGLDALMLMLRDHAAPPSPAGLERGRLTDRELEVVWLMNSGHSVAEMADVLGISPRTVENRKRRIYAKLDAHSQSHAIARTASLGIAEPAARPSRSVRDGGRAIMVVVRGPAGAGRDQVVRTLVSNGVPFVLERSIVVGPEEYPPRWYDGPVVAVLVDPVRRDWEACGSLGVPVLVVRDEQPDRTALVEALLQGAGAIVSADEVAAQLLPVLAVLACGYVAIRSNLAAPLIAHVASTPGGNGLPELTAREADILRSVGRGDSVRQTARALGIAAKTVENTQARMFRKLGVRNRAGALAMAYRLGLLGDGRSGVDGGTAGTLGQGGRVTPGGAAS